MKVAIIIKHPGRDFDYRVDIVDVPEEIIRTKLHDYIKSQMLGPFEILAMTDRVNLDRKIPDDVLLKLTTE